MKSKEREQALAETALFAMLVVIMALGLLAWILTHRARTAATAAAYAGSGNSCRNRLTRRAPEPMP